MLMQTMIGLMNVPPHASLPDLLMTIAKSHEFDSIKLRRMEKKVLNAVNKSYNDGGIRYCVPNPAKLEKAKERISSGPEKIFILVSFLLTGICTPFLAVTAKAAFNFYISVIWPK